ncbi:MAG TPA: hypothetical protein VHZ03_58060 [Trebonia sp.]|jgi:hypothetical protein|nr:hypothetical protein [Trebonia sp.]
MERADWLDGRVDPADARFLMATAITHHRFSSPIWGTREVRKLQAELAVAGTSPAWRCVAVRVTRGQWLGLVAQGYTTATSKSAGVRGPNSPTASARASWLRR